MSEPSDIVLAYWNEHRLQLRQSETQRSVFTNYVLVIAAALVGLAVQQRLTLATLPISAVIAALGGYGALCTAKYHERATYHLTQARALTATLVDLGALPPNEHVDQYRAAHYRAYPVLHRVRLHWLWTGLHLTIAAVGLTLVGVTLLP